MIDEIQNLKGVIIIMKKWMKGLMGLAAAGCDRGSYLLF